MLLAEYHLKAVSEQEVCLNLASMTVCLALVPLTESKKQRNQIVLPSDAIRNNSQAKISLIFEKKKL